MVVERQVSIATRLSGLVSRLLISLALLGAAASDAAATIYITPTDFDVACLSLSTGKEIWRHEGSMGPMRLRVVEGVVVAEEDENYLDEGVAPRRVLLSAESGRVIKRASVSDAGIGPLAELPLPLVDSRGQEYKFRSGYDDAIESADGEKTFLQLDWYPEDLLVTGDLVVFTFSPHASGAEVFAWDLGRRTLAWDFRAWHVDPTIPDLARVDIALDGDRILVSTDQHVFALARGSGAVLWHASLPRVPIRTYDAPWTTFGRVGDVLILRVYESLLALSATNGKVLWSFNAGMLSDPWPVVVGDRLYLGCRSGGAAMVSTSCCPSVPTHPISVIRVSRDSAGGFMLEGATRREVPAAATRWSVMRLPPLPDPTDPGARVELRFDEEPSIDLTTVTRSPGSTWVEFNGIPFEVTLLVGGTPRVTRSLESLEP